MRGFPDWTIERTVRNSIILISSAAILLMAGLSWKLIKDGAVKVQAPAKAVSR